MAAAARRPPACAVRLVGAGHHLEHGRSPPANAAAQAPHLPASDWPTRAPGVPGDCRCRLPTMRSHSVAAGEVGGSRTPVARRSRLPSPSLSLVQATELRPSHAARRMGRPQVCVKAGRAQGREELARDLAQGGRTRLAPVEAVEDARAEMIGRPAAPPTGDAGRRRYAWRRMIRWRPSRTFRGLPAHLLPERPAATVRWRS